MFSRSTIQPFRVALKGCVSPTLPLRSDKDVEDLVRTLSIAWADLGIEGAHSAAK